MVAFAPMLRDKRDRIQAAHDRASTAKPKRGAEALKPLKMVVSSGAKPRVALTLITARELACDGDSEGARDKGFHTLIDFAVTDGTHSAWFKLWEFLKDRQDDLRNGVLIRFKDECPSKFAPMIDWASWTILALNSKDEVESSQDPEQTKGEEVNISPVNVPRNKATPVERRAEHLDAFKRRRETRRGNGNDDEPKRIARRPHPEAPTVSDHDDEDMRYGPIIEPPAFLQVDLNDNEKARRAAALRGSSK